MFIKKNVWKLFFHRHRTFKFNSKKVYDNPCSGENKFHSKPLAKWHTNLKKQNRFDKNNLSHNRVHFSLKILQKTSDFHIFMEACWTLDCRKRPETKIFYPGLVNLLSNFRKMAAFIWLPNFRSNAPSSLIYDLYGFNRRRHPIILKSLLSHLRLGTSCFACTSTTTSLH